MGGTASVPLRQLAKIAPDWQDGSIVVTEKDFTAYEETENGVNVTMPANSVIELRLAK